MPHLLFFRFSPGNLRAKRDLKYAPYPRKIRDCGSYEWNWRRGETNETVVHASCRNLGQLTDEYEAGADYQLRRVATCNRGVAYARRLYERLPRLKEEDPEAALYIKSAYQQFPNRISQTNPATVLLFRETERRLNFRAVESLEGSGVRCVWEVADAIYLTGEMPAEWAESWGLRLKREEV